MGMPFDQIVIKTFLEQIQINFKLILNWILCFMIKLLSNNNKKKVF